MKRSGFSSRRKLRLLAIAAGCTVVAAWAGGCAQVVGLDDRFSLEPDASVQGHEGGPDNDDDDDDATTPGRDASFTDVATDDAACQPVSGWQVDTCFGADGWMVLDQPVSATPPVVITSEDGGFLDLAAAATDDGGVLLGLHIDTTRAAQGFSSTGLEGTPSDMVLQDGSLYLLTNALDPAQPGSGSVALPTVVARFDTGATTSAQESTYVSYSTGTCVGRRIVSIAGDRVLTAADCAEYTAKSGTIAFSLDSGVGVFPGETTAGGPPALVTDAVESESGIWIVGNVSGQPGPYTSGLATLVEADAGVVYADSPIPSRELLKTFAGGSTVSSVLPQEDGTAWVFGVSVGDFFATDLPGVDGGTPSILNTYVSGTTFTPTLNLPVGFGSQLQQAPTSNTRLQVDSVGKWLLVGARADMPQVAVAEVELRDGGGFDFTTAFSGTQQTIDGPPGAATFSVGGVAIVPASATDDYAYVAATLNFDGGSKIGLLRLLRHTVQ